MLRTFSSFFAVVTAATLASCGIPSPDPSLWRAVQSDCPHVLSTEQASASDLFLMSTNLPDCRTDGIAFSNFRNHRGQTVAQARLTGPAAAPASSDLTRRFRDKNAWLNAIEQTVSSHNGKLAIYVHGYNNTYRDALRTGEIVRNSFEYSVPTVVLVWPSRGRVQSYLYDEASVAWAQQFNSDTLADLAAVASDITLVSHSMGGRVLIQAVMDLDARYPERARNLKRLVIASADVDRHRVLRDGGELDLLLGYGQTEPSLSDRREIVIYTSAKDLPVRLSRFAHGYARLGSTRCKYSVEYADREMEGPHRGDCHATRPRENFWIIDTSDSLPSGLLRHGDVFDSCTGRADLRAFLTGEHDPAWREPIVLEDGRTAWRLVRDTQFEDSGTCVAWSPGDSSATP